jgi:hypothetical protein
MEMRLEQTRRQGMTVAEKAKRYDDLRAVLEHEINRLETHLAENPDPMKKNFKAFSAYATVFMYVALHMKPLDQKAFELKKKIYARKNIDVVRKSEARADLETRA